MKSSVSNWRVHFSSLYFFLNTEQNLAKNDSRALAGSVSLRGGKAGEEDDDFVPLVLLKSERRNLAPLALESIAASATSLYKSFRRGKAGAGDAWRRLDELLPLILLNILEKRGLGFGAAYKLSSISSMRDEGLDGTNVDVVGAMHGWFLRGRGGGAGLKEGLLLAGPIDSYMYSSMSQLGTVAMATTMVVVSSSSDPPESTK